MLNQLSPENGKILISEPFMLDPNFRRSVIFIVEHGEEGTVGFVLNQETEVAIHDVIRKFPIFDARIHIGGPVETDTLHYIHTLGEKLEGARVVAEGVYWGGDFETLKQLVERGEVNESQVRFFIGYSGWSPGQLDEELQQNSWIVSGTSKENLFDKDYDDFWKETIRSLGSKYAHIANFPQNPMWN